jgi:hypothetical protein
VSEALTGLARAGICTSLHQATQTKILLETTSLRLQARRGKTGTLLYCRCRNSDAVAAYKQYPIPSKGTPDNFNAVHNGSSPGASAFDRNKQMNRARRISSLNVKLSRQEHPLIGIPATHCTGVTISHPIVSLPFILGAPISFKDSFNRF